MYTHNALFSTRSFMLYMKQLSWQKCSVIWVEVMLVAVVQVYLSNISVTKILSIYYISLWHLLSSHFISFIAGTMKPDLFFFSYFSFFLWFIQSNITNTCIELKYASKVDVEKLHNHIYVCMYNNLFFQECQSMLANLYPSQYRLFV